MKKQFTSALSVVAMTTLAVSCQNDDFVENDLAPVAPSNSSTIVDDEPEAGCPTTVLSFEDFLHEGDVAIYNADSTILLVDELYVNTKGKKLDDGRPIVVWRDKHELPFPAIITSTEAFGSGKIKVNVKHADIGDVLPGGSYELSSDLYVNPNEAPRTNDGGINDLYYMEQRGSTNIYHPVAVIPAEENKTNAAQGRCLLTLADELGPVMIEDLAATNFDFDKTLIAVNLHRSDLGYKKEWEEKHTNLFVGFKDINLDCAVGFGMKLDTKVETSWWPPFIKGVKVNEFNVYERADFSMDYDFCLQGEYTFGPDEPKTIDLCKLGSYTSVFMVGVVPVAVTADAKVVFQNLFEGSVNGTIGYRGGIEYHQKCGAQYKNNNWSRLKGDDAPTISGQPYAQGAIEAKDVAGVYVQLETKLYGVAGPVLSMGPSITVDGNVSASIQKGDEAWDGMFEAGIAANFNLGATAGLEVKIAKWKLFETNLEIPIYERELFNFSGLYSWNEGRWYTNKEADDWKEEHGYN